MWTYKTGRTAMIIGLPPMQLRLFDGRETQVPRGGMHVCFIRKLPDHRANGTHIIPKDMTSTTGLLRRRLPHGDAVVYLG